MYDFNLTMTKSLNDYEFYVNDTSRYDFGINLYGIDLIGYFD